MRSLKARTRKDGIKYLMRITDTHGVSNITSQLLCKSGKYYLKICINEQFFSKDLILMLCM